MKTRAWFLLALTFLTLPGSLHAQGTAFTYQGRLNDNGGPASGTYDLSFTLYPAVSGSPASAGPVTNLSVSVSGGLFSVTLDFGPGVFTGPARWLELGVRTNGASAFATLSPRQPVSPVPYAVFANTASNLSGSLPAAQLSGVIPAANVSGTYGNVVNFNNGADSFNGTFYGQFFGSSFVGGNFAGSFIGSGAGLGDVWHTGGNLNTSPASGNFLGTTDNQPLEVRVNNVRVLRLEPDARGLNAGNVIGGHPDNAILQPGSGGNVIAGGGFGGGGGNIINSNSAGVFIGAGSGNRAGPSVFDSVIAGGLGNTVQSSDSVIAGGGSQTVQTNAQYSFIGGGVNNIAGAGWAVLVGGYFNTNNGLVAFLGAGDYNSVGFNGWYSFLGGGAYNLVNGFGAGLGAGFFNVSDGSYSFIGAGYQNTNHNNSSFIGAGYLNVINSDFSAIAGGQQNSIQTGSGYSTIGGGFGNSIGTNSGTAVLAGGGGNTIGANSDRATVSGGNGNIIQDKSPGATIGGGIANDIGTNSAVSTIAGGNFNYIKDNIWQAAIGGGLFNTNGGFGATVPGGAYNVAGGNVSFAAGYRAKATNDGAFVWADSQDVDFSSTVTNQFNVRANGGVRFVTSGAGLTLDGQPVLTGPGGSGSGINADLLDGLDSSGFALAAHSHFGATWSGSAAAGLSLNNSSTSGTGISGVASAGSGATVGVFGSASSPGGAGVSAVGSGAAGTALQVSSGGIKVTGAGLGTTTPVFVHRATAANIETGATHRTTITHPLCDGDPNAILIVTHNYNPGGSGGVLETNQVSVYYNASLSKWQLYHDNLVAMTVNASYNVLVIKP